MSEQGSSEANTGHGQVYPRPDGVKARCGGPALCSVCAKDLAMKQHAEGVARPSNPDNDYLQKLREAHPMNRLVLSNERLLQILREALPYVERSSMSGSHSTAKIIKRALEGTAAETNEVQQLRAIIDEVHAWIVCAAITTPDDLLGGVNAEHFVEITAPGYRAELKAKVGVMDDAPYNGGAKK